MIIEAYSHDPILYTDAVHVMDYAYNKYHSNLEIELYHTAINCFNKNGQSSIALALLNRMSAHGIQPNAITFICAITVVSYSGDWKNTLSLYEQAKNSIQKLPFALYRSMIRACELFNENDMITIILKDLINAGYKPDINILNIIINTTIKTKHFDQTIIIIEKMYENYKLIPHLTLFNHLIYHLTINDYWSHIQTIINIMKNYKILPDILTYYYIIYALDNISQTSNITINISSTKITNTSRNDTRIIITMYTSYYYIISWCITNTKYWTFITYWTFYRKRNNLCSIMVNISNY